MTYEREEAVSSLCLHSAFRRVKYLIGSLTSEDPDQSSNFLRYTTIDTSYPRLLESIGYWAAYSRQPSPYITAESVRVRFETATSLHGLMELSGMPYEFCTWYMRHCDTLEQPLRCNAGTAGSSMR